MRPPRPPASQRPIQEPTRAEKLMLESQRQQTAAVRTDTEATKRLADEFARFRQGERATVAQSVAGRVEQKGGVIDPNAFATIKAVMRDMAATFSAGDIPDAVRLLVDKLASMTRVVQDATAPLANAAATEAPAPTPVRREVDWKRPLTAKEEEARRNAGSVEAPPAAPAKVAPNSPFAAPAPAPAPALPAVPAVTTRPLFGTDRPVTEKERAARENAGDVTAEPPARVVPNSPFVSPRTPTPPAPAVPVVPPAPVPPVLVPPAPTPPTPPVRTLGLNRPLTEKEEAARKAAGDVEAAPAAKPEVVPNSPFAPLAVKPYRVLPPAETTADDMGELEPVPAKAIKPLRLQPEVERTNESPPPAYEGLDDKLFRNVGMFGFRKDEEQRLPLYEPNAREPEPAPESYDLQREPVDQFSAFRLPKTEDAGGKVDRGNPCDCIMDAIKPLAHILARILEKISGGSSTAGGSVVGQQGSFTDAVRPLAHILAKILEKISGGPAPNEPGLLQPEPEELGPEDEIDRKRKPRIKRLRRSDEVPDNAGPLGPAGVLGDKLSPLLDMIRKALSKAGVSEYGDNEGLSPEAYNARYRKRQRDREADPQYQEGEDTSISAAEKQARAARARSNVGRQKAEFDKLEQGEQGTGGPLQFFKDATSKQKLGVKGVGHAANEKEGEEKYHAERAGEFANRKAREVVGGGKEAYDALFAQPVEAFQRLTGAVTPFVSALAPAQVMVFGQAMRDLSATIGTAFSPIMSFATGAVRDFAAALYPVMQTLGPMFARLGEAVAPIARVFSQTFAGLIAAVAPLIELFGQLVAAVAPVIETFYAVVSGITSAISGLFRGVDLADTMKNLRTVMEKLAQSILLATAGMAKFISNNFGNNFIDGVLKAIAPQEGKDRQDTTGLAAAQNAQIGGLQEFSKALTRASLLATDASELDKKPEEWMKKAAEELQSMRGEQKASLEDIAKAVVNIYNYLAKGPAGIVETHNQVQEAGGYWATIKEMAKQSLHDTFGSGGRQMHGPYRPGTAK